MLITLGRSGTGNSSPSLVWNRILWHLGQPPTHRHPGSGSQSGGVACKCHARGTSFILILPFTILVSKQFSLKTDWRYLMISAVPLTMVIASDWSDPTLGEGQISRSRTNKTFIVSFKQIKGTDGVAFRSGLHGIYSCVWVLSLLQGSPSFLEMLFSLLLEVVLL